MLILLLILAILTGMAIYPLLMVQFPKLAYKGLPDPYKDLVAELETENYYYWTAYEFLRSMLNDERDQESIKNQVEGHITRSKRDLNLHKPERRLNDLYNVIVVKSKKEESNEG